MIRRSVNALGNRPRRRKDVQWLVNGDVVPGALGMLLVQTQSKGTEMHTHMLPAAESVTFLLSGRGDWIAGREPWPLAPGQGVYNPPDTCRAFRATDDAGAIMLVVYGGTADPGDALPRASDDAAGCGCRIAGAPDRDDSALRAAGGFIDMGVRWLATTQTVGTRALVVATSTFTPGGSHELHRHPHADEFFLVLQGGGDHLTQDGPVRLNAGAMAYIPAGEWHGFRTDPGITTRTVYGYLGAGSLAQAGYELLEEKK